MDSWLDILGRYLTGIRDEKKNLPKIIFPRYHQLDVTRKTLNAVAEEGAGGRYLIQDSAGSGKTNSIAWCAHFLADLHDADDKKLFDSVMIVIPVNKNSNYQFLDLLASPDPLIGKLFS